MQHIIRRSGVFLGLAALWATAATAGNIPVGYMSWDVNFPGNAGQFDISNDTGVNSSPFPDPTFPISSTLLLDPASLSLTVDFAGGGTTVYGPAYFTLDADGQSLDCNAIPIGGTNPEPIDATLTGNFLSTSITLNDGSTTTINAAFSPVSFSDSPNLVDGDLGVIYATTGTTRGGTPEPSTWLLLALGLGCLLISRNGVAVREFRTNFKMERNLMLKTMLPVLCLVIAQSAFAAVPAVRLNAETSPSSGVAGVNNVNITGSGFPAGTIPARDVLVTIASTCGGAALVPPFAANSVITILGSDRRVNFSIPSDPGVIVTGNYFVSIADAVLADPDFTSANCSEVSISGSNAILNACLAGSSMGVLLPKSGQTGNVTAYVPKSSWNFPASTGVFVQNIEGTIGAAVTIPTAGYTNSCSSNPATGQTVCVANDTDVYLISGTTLNATLTSGSNASTSFSGGTCNNCGVAINSSNNTAVINMGLSPSPSNSGVQILNLNTNTFNVPFPMVNEVSENISVDPTRSLILSASEGGNYTLDQIQTNGSLLEFDSTFPPGSTLDSSAEDCSTGIAIAPWEFTFNPGTLSLVNLNAITFGTGTYTAPNTTFNVPSTAYSFNYFTASAVAQGSGHLAMITGEFGGNVFVVVQLPSTPSNAVPTVVDYAVSAIPPSTACGGVFAAGYDPHTMTAYTSPNNGHSYAVFAGYSSSVPTCLAVVDMTTAIAATRGSTGYGPNDVSPANIASSVTYFPL